MGRTDDVPGVTPGQPATATQAESAAGAYTEVATSGARIEGVAYGPYADQVADLLLPAGEAPAAGWPVVVLLHGGFWREAYRSGLMAPLAVDLADRGIAAYNVEYRRVGGAGGWPATLTDVAAAVDQLAALAGSRPLDLDHVAVVGHSAGGHLALWVAGRGQLPDDAPGALPVVRPRLVVGQAAVADLAAGIELSSGAVRELLGGGPEEVPERYATADPARLVGHGVRVLLVHGEEDDTVPVELSERYAEAARIAGDDVVTLTLPGDHYTVIDPGSELWAAVIETIETLV